MVGISEIRGNVMKRVHRYSDGKENSDKMPEKTSQSKTSFELPSQVIKLLHDKVGLYQISGEHVTIATKIADGTQVPDLMLRTLHNAVPPAFDFINVFSLEDGSVLVAYKQAWDKKPSYDEAELRDMALAAATVVNAAPFVLEELQKLEKTIHDMAVKALQISEQRRANDEGTPPCLR